MFHQPDHAHMSHAGALAAAGWTPHEQRDPQDILGTVRLRDTLQHVDVGTWQLMHLMSELPVRGDVLAGNPHIRLQPAGEQPLSPSRFDNGILATVPGQYIARAGQQLPPPCSEEGGEPIRTSEIDVPHLGLVRVTFELSQHKYGRSRFWSWRPRRADQVLPGAE